MSVTIDGTTGISGSGAGLTDLNASNLSSGTVPDARFPATLPATSGANLTNLNASNLSTGTVGTARLGSGTANSTTFLRGDGSWAVAGGDPTTAQVLTATAGASVGAVGTYGLFLTNSFSISPGNTTAGSNIRYAWGNVTISGGWPSGVTTSPAGTWRAMGTVYNFGTCGTSAWSSTVFLRIS